MAKEKKMVTAITSMNEDFAQWYTDICKKADLIEMDAFRALYLPSSLLLTLNSSISIKSASYLISILYHHGLILFFSTQFLHKLSCPLRDSFHFLYAIILLVQVILYQFLYIHLPALRQMLRNQLKIFLSVLL